MRHIDPADFVLEIGSGHDPKTRSDVLCDKFIDDDIQRGGKIITDRPIVAADGQYLPFADKSFDYIICSHILEHVENPALLLNELMRVGYRGYIET
ncbi:MAG: class I SAM-dependent methyltransferase, partial [Candidatus Poribacteria bacterium]